MLTRSIHILTISILILSLPVMIFAQDFGGAKKNLDDFGKTNIGLSETSPQEIVFNVVNAVIALASVVALAFIIYGGYIWATGGKLEGSSSEDVERAQKIIVAACIGLALLIGAYFVTNFIIREIIGAITTAKPNSK